MSHRLSNRPSKAPSSAWETTRQKIAVALISLMGGTAGGALLNGCKVSLSAEMQCACNLRESTVPRGGLKSFVVQKAHALVDLYRSEDKKDEFGKLEGLLHLAKTSPIMEEGNRIQIYDLPEDAGEWRQLIAVPKVCSDKVYMRSENDALGMVFNCQYPSGYADIVCKGEEVGPDKVEEMKQELEACRLKTKDALQTARTESIKKSETDAAQPAPVDRSEFLYQLNQFRVANELPMVSYGECAQKIAREWADNPEAQAVGLHEINGNNPQERAKKAQCTGTVMENIAGPSSVSPAELMRLWENSEGHRKNLLNKDIKTIGLYCVTGPMVKTPHNFCVLTGTGDAPSVGTGRAVDAGTDASADAAADSTSALVEDSLNRLSPVLMGKSLKYLSRIARLLAEGTTLTEATEQVIKQAEENADNKPKLVEMIKTLFRRDAGKICEAANSLGVTLDPKMQCGGTDAGTDAPKESDAGADANNAELRRLSKQLRVQAKQLERDKKELDLAVEELRKSGER